MNHKSPREDARALGRSRYFTGKPCFQGHLAERLVSNGCCLECGRIRLIIWRAVNKEHLREYDKKNRPRKIEKQREWRRENPERARAYCAAWVKRNVAQVRARIARRRATLTNARCQCCSDYQFRAFYAKATKLGMEVDHKKALRLGGRHCIENLQLLTSDEHRKKTRADIALMARRNAI